MAKKCKQCKKTIAKASGLCPNCENQLNKEQKYNIETRDLEKRGIRTNQSLKKWA